MESEYSIEINLDRAWKEIDDVQYDWIEAPQPFMHTFICRYTVLENRFQGKILPNRDRMLKRKLWQGLPPEAKTRIEGFLDEVYPLNKFVN